MKTIVALVDLSDLTFKVLKHAHSLATAFNSEVIILHVLAKVPVVVDVGIASPVVMQDPSPEAVHQQTEQLFEMRDSLIKFGVRASVEQLDDASVAAVLAETRRRNADLIILGSHHHSTIYHLLVGNVAADVLKGAHCPVLVVPNDEDVTEKR
ncbi:universal stress protein [Prosthecobacter sp.]|uniref:universal stress protein n=1 Tax=Prosthecobacter sp. TaxID=1965333 RepID=UPI0024873D4D|nr:universal stress protein [Prosthecobacter sp.]MDI1312804.1 universal stress protein [Prosthecobacter sp.]